MDGGNYSHVRGSSSRGGWYHNANYRLFLPINQAESITIAFQEPGIAVQLICNGCLDQLRNGIVGDRIPRPPPSIVSATSVFI